MSFPSQFNKNAEESIGLLFIRTYHRWHSQIKESLKNTGITHPQFIILASLGYLAQKNEEVTQIEVANSAEMDVMTVSQVVTRLEQYHYIKRKTHSTDSRAKALFLTEKGTEAIQKSLPLIEAVDQQFYSILGDDKQQFMSMLKMLNRPQNNSKSNPPKA